MIPHQVQYKNHFITLYFSSDQYFIKPDELITEWGLETKEPMPIKQFILFLEEIGENTLIDTIKKSNIPF